MPTAAGPDVAAALRRVAAALPGGGEVRDGQRAMGEAVARALARREHLLVEAPTGTGKSWAYLVPAVLLGRKVVVATATKALQEQLVGDDLPFLAGALAGDGIRFTSAMLKGRSNYLCRAKLAVSLADGVEARLDFGPGGPRAALAAVGELAAWAETTETGDRADAPAAAGDAVWSQVSVDPGECPGAARCPDGARCFAEAARERAAAADVVVVNSHLYATHLAASGGAGGGVLPEHDAVVFDEAHTLENTVAAIFGVRLSGGRVRRLATALRGAGGSGDLAGRLERAATLVDDVLDLAGRAGEETRVRPTEGDLATALTVVAGFAAEASSELRRLDRTAGGGGAAGAGTGTGAGGGGGAGADVRRSKIARAARRADALRDDVARLLDPAVHDNHVAWVEPGLRGRPELHLAAVDVGPLLARTLFGSVTVVATSATLATAGRFDLLARRLGLDHVGDVGDSRAGDDGCGAHADVVDRDAHVGDVGGAHASDDAAPPAAPPAAASAHTTADTTAPTAVDGATGRGGRFRALAVPSPFDHRRQGLLYVPVHLPDPRADGYAEAMHDELDHLIRAAGGRTLALFTSRAAMERAADALAPRAASGPGTYEILVQDRLPRPALLARFRGGPNRALFATQSFWSGIDLPGALCHLVTIDRIPFPRPNDPLTQARREAATARREAAFTTVDLPAAALLLAQGAGRLIRRRDDEGVVAVFDRRLATAGYRVTLLDTLPRFARTTDRARVTATLTRLAAGAAAPVPPAEPAPPADGPPADAVTGAAPG